MPALHGSGPLLSCVPPAVLDLDKLGTGCNLAVDVRGELDLIAGSVETVVALNVTKQGSVVSAATGASDASSGCGVEGGVFAVEWSIRK